MASVSHFLYDAENIINEIENRLAAAEECAVKNFIYARLIQKIFRGFITRQHVASLHKYATCIQKNWRGFLGRIIYSTKLKEKFDETCWNFYNASATVIQKCWRGYWIRLKIFSYYSLKAWLAFVVQQNKLLKCSVEMCQNKANAAETKLREEEAKEWIVYILFKLHHLLRTHQLSGVYSLPNTTDLSQIEKLLKCLKYKDFMVFYNAYMDDLRQCKAKELPPYILQQGLIIYEFCAQQEILDMFDENFYRDDHDKCKYPGHYEREFYEHKKLHKDFLFSRTSYHNPPQTPPDMELREMKFLGQFENTFERNKTQSANKCASISREIKNLTN